jgi:hypothetical protein
VSFRNISLRVRGGADDVDDLRPPLAEVANGLGAHYVPVRAEGGDVLVNAVLEAGASGEAEVPWFKRVDIGKPDRRTPGCMRLDVWGRPAKVHDLIKKAPRPFVLYCDDGNKQLEVETFGPSLRPGDYLAVHDVGTEFFPEQMPAGYEEQLLHGLTGFYRKAGAAPC